MPNVLEVADYALKQLNTSSTMKLQKIVYYSQAWHLVRYDSPLFPERIEAWVNGPVAPDLYKMHAHEFVISDGYFGAVSHEEISLEQKSVIELVVGKLGGMTGKALSELTHSEAPWRNAREGLASFEPSRNEITKHAIRDYYSSHKCSNNPLFS